MRLVSFAIEKDRYGFGIVENEVVFRLDTLPSAVNALTALLPAIAEGYLPKMKGAERVRLDSLELVPPVPAPLRVFCVATNFHEPSMKEPAPLFPLMFTRFASSITGHGAPLLKPSVSKKFDFEGELVVIIGKPGHQIPRAEAMDYVAGYSCFNDGSVRDWQKHSTQFTPGKNFFRTAGFGPWLVTPDEMDDPYGHRLTTHVNGVLKQQVALEHMIFDVAWLIEYISTFTPVSPGDLIVTGTPSGFGSTRSPPEFLSVGDRIDVTISGIGTLSNEVRDAADPRDLSFSERL